MDVGCNGCCLGPSSSSSSVPCWCYYSYAVVAAKSIVLLLDSRRDSFDEERSPKAVHHRLKSNVASLVGFMVCTVLLGPQPSTQWP